MSLPGSPISSSTSPVRILATRTAFRYGIGGALLTLRSFRQLRLSYCVTLSIPSIMCEARPERQGMARTTRRRTPQAWLNQIFQAGQATQGNIVRRSMATVQQYAGAQALEAEVHRRGFHMAVIGDQYVIVCNRAGTINVVC
jgi:hypothetical protein